MGSKYLIGGGDSVTYSQYRALVSQSGANAPVVQGAVLSDSDITGLTWARTAQGTYTLTAASAVFLANKTVVRPQLQRAGLNGGEFNISGERTSDTVVTFYVRDAGGNLVDNWTANIDIEVDPA